MQQTNHVPTTQHARGPLHTGIFLLTAAPPCHSCRKGGFPGDSVSQLSSGEAPGPTGISCLLRHTYFQVNEGGLRKIQKECKRRRAKPQKQPPGPGSFRGRGGERRGADTLLALLLLLPPRPRPAGRLGKLESLCFLSSGANNFFHFTVFWMPFKSLCNHSV